MLESNITRAVLSLASVTIIASTIRALQLSYPTTAGLWTPLLAILAWAIVFLLWRDPLQTAFAEAEVSL